LVVVLKLREEIRICCDDANGDTRGIVTILKQDYFRRRAIIIGQCDKIRIGGDHGEAMLTCIVPDLTVGRTGDQTNVRDVMRAWKKILNCTY
jgi:hypothetical protein